MIVKGNSELDPGLENLEYELRGVLRARRGLKPTEDENFAINRPEYLTGFVSAIFGTISIAVWVIGSFSIFVGGFGIANIMFVSVKERTKQIGIQKSLGAKNSFILYQFLFESIFLCLIGGIIGLTLVFLLTQFVSNFFDFSIDLTLEYIALGLSVSAIIGIISGIVPALSASKLDPVEAIRS
jgi:putative ABC transport system permease protein